MTLHILALCGSLRAASINAALLRAAARIAPAGSRITLCPQVALLPLFNPDLESAMPPQVQAFHHQVANADALLIASPEYAHGVTAVIKNALDWLVSYEPFVGKPVAIWNAAPRAQHADAQLRETLRTMSANIIEAASVTMPLAGKNQDEDGMLAQAELVAVMQGALGALVDGVRELQRQQEQ